MKKAVNILTGWGKALKLLQTSNAEEKLSELRLKQCAGCPLSKESKVLSLFNGNAGYENQLYCTKCSCPCLQKTLVADEKCPVGLW